MTSSINKYTLYIIAITVSFREQKIFAFQVQVFVVEDSEGPSLQRCTVVWKKLVVGNIHEKKFHGKIFLSQHVINYSISLWQENFRVFNFCSTWRLTKIFYTEYFPNYGICFQRISHVWTTTTCTSQQFTLQIPADGSMDNSWPFISFKNHRIHIYDTLVTTRQLVVDYNFHPSYYSMYFLIFIHTINFCYYGKNKNTLTKTRLMVIIKSH